MSKKNQKSIPPSINQAASTLSFDTLKLFKASRKGGKKPVIDLFIENLTEINKVTLTSSETITGLLGLLGYVSAVEGYFRQIFREIILFDQYARKKCLSHDVSFGAALVVSQKAKAVDSLPEALLENVIFASKKNITEAIKHYLDIKGNLPDELETALKEFEKICQLRHCAVHRYGQFGSQNAIALGFDGHSKKIGFHICLELEDLENIATICLNLVKVVNNFLFNKLLERSAKDLELWKDDYVKDKKLFKKYCAIFKPTNKTIGVTKHYKTLYNQFRNRYA